MSYSELRTKHRKPNRGQETIKVAQFNKLMRSRIAEDECSVGRINTSHNRSSVNSVIDSSLLNKSLSMSAKNSVTWVDFDKKWSGKCRGAYQKGIYRTVIKDLICFYPRHDVLELPDGRCVSAVKNREGVSNKNIDSTWYDWYVDKSGIIKKLEALAEAKVYPDEYKKRIDRKSSIIGSDKLDCSKKSELCVYILDIDSNLWYRYECITEKTYRIKLEQLREEDAQDRENCHSMGQPSGTKMYDWQGKYEPVDEFTLERKPNCYGVPSRNQRFYYDPRSKQAVSSKLIAQLETIRALKQQQLSDLYYK